MGLSQIVSIATAGLIAIGFYFYVDQVPTIVRKLHDKYKIRKLILILLSFIPPISLFSLLATLRIQYAVATQGTTSESTALAFIGINTLIYCVALLICYRYQVPKEEKERFDVYNNQKKQIEKEENAIAQLWTNRQKLGEELRKRCTIIYNAFQTIASMERDVELKYNSTCSGTKSALLFKSNGKAAFLFENDETDFPPLKLYYQNLPELFQKYATDREVFRTPTPNSGNANNKLLLMVLPLILAVAACTPPKTHHIKFLPDMTDSMEAVEHFIQDTQAVVHLVTTEHLQDQQTISVDYITDRRLAEEGVRITLPKGSIALLDNDIERGKEIDSFVAYTSLIYQHIKQQKIGRASSYVFYHLHRCLNELIQEQNDYSALYVFTDGVEQSPWLNLYYSVQFQLFTTNTVYCNSILNQFKLDSLKTGKKLELHFIYQGKDKLQEERFHTIIGSVAPYYLERGIQVFTGRSAAGTKPIAAMATLTPSTTR